MTRRLSYHIKSLGTKVDYEPRVGQRSERYLTTFVLASWHTEDTEYLSSSSSITNQVVSQRSAIQALPDWCAHFPGIVHPRGHQHVKLSWSTMAILQSSLVLFARVNCCAQSMKQKRRDSDTSHVVWVGPQTSLRC